MRAIVAVMVVAASVPCAFGALSGNLLNNANFETTAYLKNWSTTDSLGTHIPVWRWDAENDPGNWIAWYGPPSVCAPDGCLASAGFSTHDNPRNLALNGNVAPYNTQTNADLGAMNRSYVDTDGNGTPDNHVMENTMFYPQWGQWFVAPANQSPGPIKLSFDFYLKEWDPPSPYAATVMKAYVYGTYELPQHNVGIWGTGNALQPIEFDKTTGERLAGSLNGDLLMRFNWGSWWNDVWGDPDTPDYAGNNHGWLHVENDGGPLWDTLPHTQGGKDDTLTFETTQAYPYYAVVFTTRTYHEGHEYFWAYDWRATDALAVAVDNVSLQLSLAASVLRGDVNLDGLVNALDISPFVTRLTSGSFQAEADINQDSLVNALDISGFVTCLVNGACAGAAGAAVPEPASPALMALAGVGLWRRRS